MTTTRPLCLLLAVLTTTLAADWETVTLDGWDHVTVRSIKAFYEFDTFQKNEGELKLENAALLLKFQTVSREVFINNLKFLFSSRILAHEGRHLVSRTDLDKILDPVLRPDALDYKISNTVILDPQPMPPGPEADFAHLVALKAKRELERLQFKVVLGRNAGQRPEIKVRLAEYNQLGDATLVSLRVTRDADQAAGLRTWTMAPVGVPGLGNQPSKRDLQPLPGNRNDGPSTAIATALHGSGLVTGRLDRGIACSRDPLLSASRHPAVILEIGNLAHPKEAALLEDDGYQRALAKSIAHALIKVKMATKRRPTSPHGTDRPEPNSNSTG